MIDRRTLIAAPALLTPGLAAAQASAPAWPAPTEQIPLWPGRPPGQIDLTLNDRITERSTDAAIDDRALDRIANPRLDVFRALVPTGASVLITPGGGYQRVVIDREGWEMGAWFAARGITAFVLFYRLPAEGWEAGSNVALADAQRAMRLIRARAGRYGIDPVRTAVLGFSAGGHLCADLATRWDRDAYTAIDAADRQPARPFLAAPIYPVVEMDTRIAHRGSREKLIGLTPTAAQETEHSPNRQVRADTPPLFIAHAEDDDVVPVDNALALRAAARAAKVPVETHLFTAGGHGFGLRRAIGKPAGVWPDLFLAWARTQGWLNG